MSKLNIGIVGATGKVGKVFLTLLEERKTPVKNLKLFCSERNKGLCVSFNKKNFKTECLKPGCFSNLDLVFFSAGEDISLEWAPKALQEGALVVDNSSAFRDSHKLIVNEVNAHLLNPKKPEIIANPNCSTMQLMLLIHPLNQNFSIDYVKMASYQSVSGYGYLAEKELLEQTKHYLKHSTLPKPEVFPHPIAFNTIPQIGHFNQKGLCTEEDKIIKETRKILDNKNFKISPFTVRVPSLNGHAEAVWVCFKKPINKEELLKTLKNQKGLTVLKESENYPTVLQSSGHNDVYVGRIHQDVCDEKTWVFWVVSDNLRKGAALNSLQIAESFFDIKNIL